MTYYLIFFMIAILGFYIKRLIDRRFTTDNKMKPFLTFLMTLLIVLPIIHYTQPFRSDNKLTVGILQIVEHPALNESRKGFIDGLKKHGFVDGENIRIIYESAQGNPVLATQISQKFVGQDVDLVVTLGTTPSQAALQSITQDVDTKQKIPSLLLSASGTKNQIPLVFLSVSDPLSAKLVSVGENGQLVSPFACGISNYVPAHDQLTFFKKVLPHVKKIGIIYNPGEDNSVFSLKEFEKLSDSFDVQIIGISASKTSEVVLAAQAACHKVDLFFVDNDNTALSAFSSLSKFCLEAKIPLFVSDFDLKDLALGSLGPNQYEVGLQGSDFAALLLKQQSQPEKLGVRYPTRVQEFVNPEFAKAIGLSCLSA